MRPEGQIKPGIPGLAAVGGGDADFAHAPGLRLPHAADAAARAFGGIGAAEDHFTGFEAAFEHQQFSAIRDPGLMPHFPSAIVNAEALAFVPVCVLIVLEQGAAIQYAGHGQMRYGRAALRLKRVPIARPGGLTSAQR